VLQGVAIGLALTAAVGWVTFVLQERLPYRRMLIATGVLLGVVLLVMVGESVQEMQLAGWLPGTSLGVAFVAAERVRGSRASARRPGSAVSEG
jgi:high-affinity iron transporter